MSSGTGIAPHLCDDFNYGYETGQLAAAIKTATNGKSCVSGISSHPIVVCIFT